MSACGRFLPLVTAAVVSVTMAVEAQMIDNNQAPNVAKAGINKSLQDEIGAGRGNVTTPGSSMCMIAHDPYRAIRRGRQLFQRKFTHAQGQGPNENDGVGDINTRSMPSELGWPTAARFVMDGRAGRREWAATS